MSLSFTVADNTDGTGGLVTITGSTMNTVYTIYYLQWPPQAATGLLPWITGGHVTDSGQSPLTIAVSAKPGNWLFFLAGVLLGVTTFASPQKIVFRPFTKLLTDPLGEDVETAQAVANLWSLSPNLLSLVPGGIHKDRLTAPVPAVLGTGLQLTVADNGDGTGAVASVTGTSPGATTWLLGNVYAAGQFVTDGGTAYQCTSPNTAAANNEPGSGVNWHTYWVVCPTNTLYYVKWTGITGNLVLTTGGNRSGDGTITAGLAVGPYLLMAISVAAAPTWVLGNTYVPGLLVTDSGTVYQCLLANTGLSTNEPGVGVNWATYWQVAPVTPFTGLVFQDVTTLAGLKPPYARLQVKQAKPPLYSTGDRRIDYREVTISIWGIGDVNVAAIVPELEFTFDNSASIAGVASLTFANPNVGFMRMEPLEITVAQEPEIKSGEDYRAIKARWCVWTDRIKPTK